MLAVGVPQGESWSSGGRAGGKASRYHIGKPVRNEPADCRVGVNILELTNGVVADVANFSDQLRRDLPLYAKAPLLRVRIVEVRRHNGLRVNARIEAARQERQHIAASPICRAIRR